MKYKNVKEITESFIKDGWKNDTTFKELSLQDAKEKGYSFAIDNINKGRKYFVMDITGNVFDDNGKIAMYNVSEIIE